MSKEAEWSAEGIATRLSHANYYRTAGSSDNRTAGSSDNRTACSSDNRTADGSTPHLVNSPQPIAGQAEPRIAVFRDFGGPTLIPKYSVVIPVHNQATIIERNLTALIENTAGTFEIIIVCDACTDGTLEKITAWAAALPAATLYHRDIFLTAVVVVDQPTPVFETTCDNIGFTVARGKFIVEVQADMQMIQYGYNVQLAKPFALYPDIFAVSGRAALTFDSPARGIGKIDGLIGEKTRIPLEHMNNIFIFESCCRGPLLIERTKLEQLGYLDEQNFWLGDDDHDLCARAIDRGWRSGYVPIEFFSPLADGSTRKPRSPENQRVYDARKKRSNGGRLAAGRPPRDSPNLVVRPLTSS